MLFRTVQSWREARVMRPYCREDVLENLLVGKRSLAARRNAIGPPKDAADHRRDTQ